LKRILEEQEELEALPLSELSDDDFDRQVKMAGNSVLGVLASSAAATAKEGQVLQVQVCWASRFQDDI
jgi:hypothetical protein